ncbi:MAG: polysaccharide pyruvyl transferase family protein [Pseudomonadota bacterium]
MNVKFSPNLGDGLLSECLEGALIEHGASPQTRSADLAGRTAYGDTMAGRGAIMKTLDALPGGLRQFVVRAPLAIQSRRKWMPHYLEHLAQAEAVAIGGGNLLADQDLNFPTKIALALRACATRDVPVAFYACGMGQKWSSEGERRVRSALRACPPRAVFLRDQMSKERWDSMFAEASGQEAIVVRDPGLLARQTYGAVTKAPHGGPRIGISVMSHIAIRYHAEAGQSEAALLQWYADLAIELIGQGAQVTLFTNGASEDNIALEAVTAKLSGLREKVDVVVPNTPKELSDIVGGLTGLVAYRMHALISAYSHRVPFLALKWDEKVDAFLESVGALAWLDDAARLTAKDAAIKMLDHAELGIDADRHASVIQQAGDDVGRLFAALTASA